MVSTKPLRWSIPCSLLFGAAFVLGLNYSNGWLLWIGMTGLAPALISMWHVASAPRYVAFMILGTSRTSFLWRSDTWSSIEPKLTEVLNALGGGASIVWFPDRKNRSSEKSWSETSKNIWTYPVESPLAGRDRIEFFESYIYSPARRQLVEKGLPTLYVRISNHQPRSGEERRSGVTQCMVLLVRKRAFRKHEKLISGLVRAVGDVVEAPVFGYCEPRMGHLNDFESLDLSPIYRDVHLQHFPDFGRMAMPWASKPFHHRDLTQPST
jgi:hypothetical protein